MKDDKQKLRIFAQLFKHKVNGKDMTYIFISDSTGSIKRARVPLKNNLPSIENRIDWKAFEII